MSAVYRIVSLGKFGNFHARELLGRPYGETYEIKDMSLMLVQATLNEIGEPELLVL